MTHSLCSSGVDDDDFYRNLESFANFSEIAEDRHYRQAPEDWSVVITDVKGSTEAIAAGRYKDVNTIGAAAIATVRNAVGGLHFPSVFGGDGATLLLPPSVLEKASRKLCGLRNLAASRFHLELRIGTVTVRELIDRGTTVEVAKYELVNGRCTAAFRGGGLALAEKLVKTHPEEYSVRQEGETPDLGGLSCRWNPIPSESGRILSLLVSNRGSRNFKTYGLLLKQIDEILLPDPDSANPVKTGRMTYRSIRECRQDEKRYHSSPWSLSYLLRMAEIVGAVLTFKKWMHPVYFHPPRYVRSMRTHSDYRKFDDMLRMVVDCTPDQTSAIRRLLDEKHRAGEIYFGIHESDTSLITCLVDGLGDGHHLHFIDGGDGGYAMAARQLELQKASA